jgi:hypothetical protein
MGKTLNYYLLSFLITIIGIILFLLNAKEIVIIPGLFIIAFFFMLAPCIYHALQDDQSYINKVFSITLLLMLLLTINYIFVITQGSVVGMEDQHGNIFEYSKIFSDNAKINFSEIISLSYAFVGMYMLYYFISIFTNFGISQIVYFIPQFLNVIFLMTIYLLVNRIHSHNIAIIVALLYGFQTWVLYFGQEMRTQTFGILLLFLTIVIIVIFKGKKNSKDFFPSILLICVLFSLVASAFVSIFLSSLVFIGFLLFEYLSPVFFKDFNNEVVFKLTTFLVFLFAFILYLYYITLNMFNIPDTIKWLFNNIETSSALNINTIVQSTNSDIKNILFSIVPLLNSLILRVYQVALLIYIYLSFKQKNYLSLLIISGFIPLIILYYVTIYIPVLNSPRILVFVYFLYVLGLSFCLITFFNKLDNQLLKKTAKIVIIFSTIFIIIISIVQMPNYIIGETKPLRAEGQIDAVTWYNADLPQNSLYNFVKYYNPNQTIISKNVVDYYYMKLLIDKNNKIEPDPGYRNKFLLILHDKFYGKEYVTRDSLSPSSNFNDYDMIYSNNDYLIFYK